MSRVAFALSLVCCMLGLTALAGVEPGGQEKKVADDLPKADKQEDKAKTTKAPPAAQDKMAVEGKVAVKAVAVPLQPAPVAKKAVKAAKAVQRRAAPAMFAVPVGGDLNFFEQQFWPQLKSMHKAELHFMRTVCQPTREQFDKIAADSEPLLKEAVKKLGGNNQNGLQNGMVIINAAQVGMNGDDQTDAALQVSSAVAKSVRKLLPAELADRYEKELADRVDSSHRVVVRSFVIKMDKLLRLSSEQRDAIQKLLVSKWKYSANRARLLTIGDQYFPVMPDAEINQILNEAQRRVWSSVQKGNISFGVQLEAQAQVDFEEVWDEPAKKLDVSNPKMETKEKSSEKKERK